MTEPEETERLNFDAYAPKMIALRVEQAAVAKTEQRTLQSFALALLAGAFIAFGALFYTLVVTGSQAGFGPTRLIGGIAFSLGLVLVIVAGAELFTGNNLMVMAWADRRIRLGQLLWSWALVYVGNLIGALAVAVLVILAGIHELAEQSVGHQAAQMALAKLSLPLSQAFFRGILCNTLVCLAVWLTFAARSVTDKILAIVFPITAFVACGFEHSVANMYVMPVAMMGRLVDADIPAFLSNLTVVTAGNIVGGGFFVAIIYWLIYRRSSSLTE